MKKKILKWIKIIVAIYIVAGIVLYFFQDKFLFQSEALKADYHFQFTTPFKEINIAYDSFTTFNIIRFYADNNSIKKGAVIYCHGNMENINHYAAFAPNFTKDGYDVWMIYYPFFGKSTFPFIDIFLYEDSLHFYNLFVAFFISPASFFFFLYSLFTSIASPFSTLCVF